ncbi:MAG: prepilin-type N-terminal cleavage/methylation domain-containing protein [Methylococcales bacterium]|jgi:general secretion pathway protein I
MIKIQVNKQKGFSLLEILIAFSILAFSLGILLKIFSSGVNTASVAEDYTAAVQIAESLMAKTGLETPLQVGQDSGTENEKYDWLLTVNPYIFELGTSTSDTDYVTTTMGLFKVKVIVSWGQAANKRRIELTTLKLGYQNK